MCICIVNTSYPLEYKNRRQHTSIFFIYFDIPVMSRNDHTTMTAPLPVCSAKLSIVGPG